MKDNSAVGDSIGNAMVERVNFDVEARIRTMAAALEEKTGQNWIQAAVCSHGWCCMQEFYYGSSQSAKMARLHTSVSEGVNRRSS